MEADSPDARLSKILSEMDSYVDSHVIQEARKFQEWAVWPRIFFRTTGTLLIILSISLPLISAIEWQHQDLLVSGIALTVALLTAFNTFFSWDQTWKTNYTTALLLENAVSEWKTRVLRAKHQPDAVLGIEIAYEAYEKLLAESNRIKAQNVNTYFASVKPPEVKSKS